MVANLLDGVNLTRDDLHMWLAPFTPSHPHTVTITFTTPITLALVRVWVCGYDVVCTCTYLPPTHTQNYNKSRIHSHRGVRDLQMWLDNRLIFQGEISR